MAQKYNIQRIIFNQTNEIWFTRRTDIRTSDDIIAYIKESIAQGKTSPLQQAYSYIEFMLNQTPTITVHTIKTDLNKTQATSMLNTLIAYEKAQGARVLNG